MGRPVDKHALFEDITGKKIVTIRGAEVGNNRVKLTFSDGSAYVLYHEQDCCESVDIAEVHGDVDDLLGYEVLRAVEVSDADGPDPGGYTDESYTWTFYRIYTIKGFLVLRWLGQSNGYYSERVDFRQIALED